VYAKRTETARKSTKTFNKRAKFKMASVRWEQHGNAVKVRGHSSDYLPCLAVFVLAIQGKKNVIVFSKPLTGILALMHDSLTFLARYIQTRGRQLPDFGTFGITPLASIRIGRGKSHTTATSLATLGGGRGAENKGVRPSSPHDPPHVLLR
jgi:hypothetical protein